MVQFIEIKGALIGSIHKIKKVFVGTAKMIGTGHLDDPGLCIWWGTKEGASFIKGATLEDFYNAKVVEIGKPKVEIDEDDKELAAAMREKREREGHSIRELSKLIGISFSSLARIERGEGAPSNKSGVIIAEWLEKE